MTTPYCSTVNIALRTGHECSLTACGWSQTVSGPTFENDNNFVGGVREVFPSLAGWIGPEIATETTCRPVGKIDFVEGRKHLPIVTLKRAA